MKERQKYVFIVLVLLYSQIKVITLEEMLHLTSIASWQIEVDFFLFGINCNMLLKVCFCNYPDFIIHF